MAEDGIRLVDVLRPESENHEGFLDNKVVTSQYTALNFPAKNLGKQFRRAANCYFLIISIMQTIPAISITGGIPTTLLPLMFVLFVTALKDGLEDYARHKADDVENNRETHRCTAGDIFATNRWSEVRAGDVVQLHNRDQIPADLLILASSDRNGLCFVMTANLDGETNLKLRQAHADIQLDRNRIFDTASSMTVECETPNKHLDHFEGTLVHADGSKVSLTPKNLLLRGCQLRNTDWVIGVVLYTGHETKIQMNAAGTAYKVSTLARMTNKETFRVFALQLLLCLVAAIAHGVWIGSGDVVNSAYLWADDDVPDAGFSAMLAFFTFIIIFTNFIPISLLVTLDMVKFFQAQVMNLDIDCYYEEIDVPLQVRSSDLNEELGMIQHVFSDKTGTLTCNVMEFRKCSIGGTSYGLGTTEIGRGVLQRKGLPIPEEPVPGPNDPVTPNVNFIDPALNDVLGAPAHASHRAAREFFTHLAINHDVMPEDADDGSLVYSASSPDEGALVYAARHFGFFFNKRELKTVTVHMDGRDRQFNILQVLEFTSTRKRSSVIVRDEEDGHIFLYCKGADNVIWERLGGADVNDAGVLARTQEHITQYCDDGLRTLVIAKADVDAGFYEEWAVRFHEAETSLENRDEKRWALMDEMECNLQVLGATAIEDKLQDGVSDTISCLREAGVRVWVLTGDKVDTAINIGFSCSLLTTEMEQVRICGEDGEMPLDNRGLPTGEALLERLKREIAASYPPGTEVALVVDTGTIECVLQNDLAEPFLELCERCKSVVCARVSPDQKAQTVGMVRRLNPDVITLAIGDGANDVPMIQRAHVGIGIAGQEGLQAVNSSDYAIGQFRFLKKLLLVHGRWSYRRLCYVTLYMFYKNCLLVLPQFWYGFFSLASGQNVYYDGLYQLYNVAYTALPVICMGVFDKDVEKGLSLARPTLYNDSRLQTFMTVRIFWTWMLEATVCSLVVFFVPLLALGHGDVAGDGKEIGLWDLGTLINVIVVQVAHQRISFETKSWNGLYVFFLVGSVLFYWMTFGLFSNMVSLASAVYGSFSVLTGSPVFWLSILLASWVCFLTHFVPAAWRALFQPDLATICREQQRGHNAGGLSEADGLGPGLELR